MEITETKTDQQGYGYTPHKLVFLTTGVALTILGTLQLRGILSLKGVNGWALAAPGIAMIGSLTLHQSVIYSLQASIDLKLRKLNQAEHIPPESFRELIHFLRQYADASIQEAIDQGLLLEVEELYLNEKKISFLPAEIGFLTNLKVFEVSKNNLTKLPENLGNLAALRSLLIGDNPSLSKLPTSLRRCRHLRQLVTDGTQIPPAVRTAFLKVAPDYGKGNFR